MKVGIVGMPNAGKSSLFNALSRAGAEAANYPFTTIEPNVAVVPVADERLDAVARTIGASSIVPDTIEFHDIAGLVAGAHKGEGLGNKFLANIRETDALLHVVRAHGDENVIHPEGRVDPAADIETIETELLYADLEQAERRHQRVVRTARSGDKVAIAEQEWLERVIDALNAGQPVRTVAGARGRSERHARPLAADRQAGPLRGQRRRGRRRGPVGDRRPRGRPRRRGGGRVLADRGRAVRARRRGGRRSCARRWASASRASRASSAAPSGCSTCWPSSRRARTSRPSRGTCRRGLTAWHAAGEIHSDIQRGFVRAEVIGWQELVDAGGYGAGARARHAAAGGAGLSDGRR